MYLFQFESCMYQCEQIQWQESDSGFRMTSRMMIPRCTASSVRRKNASAKGWRWSPQKTLPASQCCRPLDHASTTSTLRVSQARGKQTWDRYHGGRRRSSDKFSQSDRHSTMGIQQTEYHKALPSSANDEVRYDCTFTDNGYASWYSVSQLPMVEWRLDCEKCRHLTVVGLHNTGPWRQQDYKTVRFVYMYITPSCCITATVQTPCTPVFLQISWLSSLARWPSDKVSAWSAEIGELLLAVLGQVVPLT